MPQKWHSGSRWKWLKTLIPLYLRFWICLFFCLLRFSLLYGGIFALFSNDFGGHPAPNKGKKQVNPTKQRWIREVTQKWLQSDGNSRKKSLWSHFRVSQRAPGLKTCQSREAIVKKSSVQYRMKFSIENGFSFRAPLWLQKKQGPGLKFSIENEDFKPRINISSENENVVRGGMVFSCVRARMNFFDLRALWELLSRFPRDLKCPNRKIAIATDFKSPGNRVPRKIVAKGSSVSWVAKLKGGKNSECKLSNGGREVTRWYNCFFLQGNEWSRREINQHPCLP